jgi:hypothetical protein
MRARLLSVALLILLAACASGGGGGAAAGGGGGGGGNANLLTQADITSNQLSMGEPLNELIQRVRPAWLAVRSGQPEPTVYIDGVNSGNLTALRTVNAGSVREVRFYRAEQAAARFGGGNDGGVIEVTRSQ